MDETMLAAVLHGREDLRLERVPLPVPDRGELLLRVDAALGSQARPLSDAALDAKFRASAGAGADARIAAVWSIDSAASVRPLMAAMVPPARG